MIIFKMCDDINKKNCYVLFIRIQIVNTVSQSHLDSKTQKQKHNNSVIKK